MESLRSRSLLAPDYSSIQLTEKGSGTLLGRVQIKEAGWHIVTPCPSD